MVKEVVQKHHTKSKLEQYSLGFEYNRTLAEERKMTKHRTTSNA